MPKTRVFTVSDDPDTMIFLKFFAMTLEGGWEIVGEATDEDALVGLAGELAAEVILMDVDTLRSGAVDPEAVVKELPETMVLIIDYLRGNEYVIKVTRYGTKLFTTEDYLRELAVDGQQVPIH